MKENNQELQYMSAVGFYKNSVDLAQQINIKAGNKAFEIAPIAAVNLSFSAELFLKLLFNTITKDVIITEHQLKKLFYKLPVKIQDEIKTRYEYHKGNNTRKLFPIKLTFNTYIDNPKDFANNNEINNLTLERLLDLHSDGFIKWRYVFEVKQEYYHYEFNFNLMNAFVKSLIDVLKNNTTADLRNFAKFSFE